MRTRLSLAGLVLALASTCFAQQPAPAPAADDFVPLTLPPALVRAPGDKNQNPVLNHAWTTRAVDVNGLRAVVSLPSEWFVREQASASQILQIVSVNGRRLSAIMLAPFRPMPLALNHPIPKNFLTELSRIIGGGGVTVNGVGQMKLDSRYWIWMETLAPKAARPPGFPDDLPFDSFRVWTFNTTEADHMVQVTLTVGMPQGSTAEDIDAEVHAAADVFLEILKRITFEPGTSPPYVPPARPARPDPGPLPEGVVRVDQSGVTRPIIVTQVSPAYTVDAMRERIAGVVVLECVVETDGSVGYVRVRRSLDAVDGLDDEAVKAAKQWRFKPGTKDGVPVRVAVSIEMSFTLRPTPPPEDGK